MEKAEGQRRTEKAGVSHTPVTLMDSEFNKVVVSEIEHDSCLTTKETLCSSEINEEGNPHAEFSHSSSIDCDASGNKVGDADGNGESCVISASDEGFKTNGTLHESIEHYEQSPSLMTSISNSQTCNAGVNGMVDQGNDDHTDNSGQTLAGHSDNQLQKETDSVFGTIQTLTTTPGSVQSNSATYLSLDSLCQLQTLTNHPLLNTTELTSGIIDAGTTHYVINSPQIQGINALQTMNQPGTGQVMLLQVPSSQNGNQVFVTQVSNANVSGVSSQGQPITHARSTESIETKRTRTKAAAKGKSKRMKLENSNPTLRPLAPRIVAVPISSPLVIASSSATAQMYPSGAPMDQLQNLSVIPPTQISRTAGQHFEILGRCIVCFRFCRTTTYCRAEKNHTNVRAAACADCEAKGCSTVVCRRKRQHKEDNAYPPNIVINTALARTADLKEMCIKNLLPPCFSELHSLTVHHADCIFSQPRAKNESEDQIMTIDGVANGEQVSYRKPTDYARGYLYPYTKEALDQWLAKFCAQTGTNYRIRTGKRVNKKSDHGLANHNGKIVVYRALESQLHNCALGGKPRKKAVREGSKRRKSRGSKLIGCPAVIHTRLIVTEEHWKALEITVPKLSAHLPVHDPRITNTELTGDVSSMIYSDSLYDSEQGVTNQSQEDYAIMEDVGFHNEAELANEQMQYTMHVDDLKKHIRNLMSECGNMLDGVSNMEALKTIHLHVDALYNELLPVTTNQNRSRKRTANEASLMHAEEVLDEGEARSETVRQVVLLQSEQV